MSQTTETSADESAPTPGTGIDVTHLSALARLAIDAETASAAAADLQSIVNLIDAMRSVDTDGVEPLSHPLDGVARLRADQVTENPDPEHLQRNAPATSDAYYLVPRVVE